MNKRAPVMAGTALALVMAATQASAAPQTERILPPQDTAFAAAQAGGAAPVLLAQADEDLTEEELLLRRQQEEEAGEEPAEPPADAAPAPVEEPAGEAPVDEPPADEAPEAETPEDAPAPEPAPMEEAPADEAPAAETPEDAPTPDEAPADEAPEQAPADEVPEAETPADAPAPEPAPVDEAPAPAGEPAGEVPADQPPADETPAQAPADEAPEAETPAEAPEPAPVDEAPAGEAPADEAPEAEEPGDAPMPDEAPADEAPDGAQPADDVDAGQPTDDEPQAENEAPILDSQKEDAASGEPAATDGEPQQEPADAPPPPASEEEAREDAQPAEIESVRAEEGQRTERRERRRERREDADVIREIGDRIVIQLNNQVVVQSDDRGRIGRDAEEVYYEDLPRGRTRETVVRQNGVQVVTVYDRYGDVVRRSRIMPDGREYVLVYATGDDREGRRGWRDPAADLPPLRLRIPRDEYILEARNVQDPDVYYDFLDQPPVERVERLYTIDEVKYSARVRDIARRVELDTITFDFGSAAISESAIPQLEGVAGAIERLLDDNPAETFLIEGHTDAVGSDEANLALSDQRAESVAAALTNVFGIPPENLVTQGYGERYLKIETQEPEQENRRVVMRRITPLVAPMASR